MKNILHLAICAVCTVALTGCSNEPDDPQSSENETPVVIEENGEMSYISSLGLTTQEKNVVERNNAFAWDFFGKRVDENRDNNVAVSPLSASIALTMLANGAFEDSKARAEIVNALGYAGIDMADVNSCVMKLADGIDRLDEDVELALANSLWVDSKSLTLNPEYVAILKKDFAAESYPIIQEKFVDDVNHWCDVKTRGMIKQLLPNDYKPQDMSLINATYFKGAWSKSYGFDEKRTAKGSFIGRDGVVSYHDFMIGVQKYRVYSNETMEAIEMPFGNGNYQFCMIRPLSDKTINDCIDVLKDGEWNNFISSAYKPEYLEVKLPKFDIEAGGGIKELLASMGMEYALKQCDYYFATPKGLVVGDILHKTRLRVNEEGAEAAGVTDINMEAGAPDPSEEDDTITVRPFYLDHPFIYLIREKSSGAILFIGCINNL